MADTNTRQAKRTPVTLKIKFKSATLDQFIERYAVDVSQGGIFIRTKDPLAVGTTMRFEFQLRDSTPLIVGEGTVVWTRENDPNRAGVAPGMGVRFDRLGDGSQDILEQILAKKTARAPRESAPPAFAETPTKVAPSPLVAGLQQESGPGFGEMAPPRGGFGDERTDATPLPSPMPFASDADDFPEEAFEEATKVRSLDELVAATREEDSAQPAPAGSAEKDEKVSDELASARAKKAEVAVVGSDDDNAKAQAAKAAKAAAVPEPSKLVSAKDSERAETVAAKPSATKAGGDADKDKAADKPAAKTAAAKEPAAAEKKGGGGFAIAAAAVILLGGGGYYYMTQVRGKAEPAPSAAVAPVPEVVTPPPVEPPPVEPPPVIEAPPVVTFTAALAVTPEGATVAEVGGTASATSPGELVLEEGKPHRVTVSHPGFLAQEVEVTQGQPIKVTLLAKPRFLSVQSTPAGAAVWLNGFNTGKKTPAEIELVGRFANKKNYAVSLRLAGFDRLDKNLEGVEFSEEAERMVVLVSESMSERVAAVKPADTKPADTKPADTKPADTKPADTKPADTKPADTKPADTKPADTKPADTKPADTKPADTKPADTKPADTKPADTKPTDTKPADTKPADSTEPTPDWMK